VKGTYSPAEMAGRMRTYYYSTYKQLIGPGQEPEEEQPDHYEALCRLDFKLQTENFKQIYKQKKVAAFLLHGDCDQDGNDIHWLHNQLRYLENLSRVKDITIDYSIPIGKSYDRLLTEILTAFRVDQLNLTRPQQLKRLRIELDGNLKAGHYICVIKHPNCLLGNEEELDLLFSEFFAYMDEHLDDRSKYKLIFLFLEHGLAPYQTCKANYFTWFDKTLDKDYAWNIIKDNSIKIVDLAPVHPIRDSDIKDWVNWWSGEYPSLYTQLDIIMSEASEIAREGPSPYKVITTICNRLKIPIQDAWTA
jgi:hypothetical protein